MESFCGEQKNSIYKKGFTLIELMVALSVFSFVMVISMGSITSVLDANYKADTLRSVMDNLNLSMDNMTRTIRFGDLYNCGSAAPLARTVDCSTSAGASSLTVRTLDPNTGSSHEVTFSLGSGSDSTRIVRTIDSQPTYYITSQDIIVDSLKFYVTGTNSYSTSGDTLQPKVIISIRGHAGLTGTSHESTFTLQTSVTQRKLDI